jgi:hypothetical protein
MPKLLRKPPEGWIYQSKVPEMYGISLRTVINYKEKGLIKARSFNGGLILKIGDLDKLFERIDFD